MGQEINKFYDIIDEYKNKDQQLKEQIEKAKNLKDKLSKQDNINKDLSEVITKLQDLSQKSFGFQDIQKEIENLQNIASTTSEIERINTEIEQLKKEIGTKKDYKDNNSFLDEIINSEKSTENEYKWKLYNQSKDLYNYKVESEKIRNNENNLLELSTLQGIIEEFMKAKNRYEEVKFEDSTNTERINRLYNYFKNIINKMKTKYPDIFGNITEKTDLRNDQDYVAFVMTSQIKGAIYGRKEEEDKINEVLKVYEEIRKNGLKEYTKKGENKMDNTNNQNTPSIINGGYNNSTIYNPNQTTYSVKENNKPKRKLPDTPIIEIYPNGECIVKTANTTRGKFASIEAAREFCDRQYYTRPTIIRAIPAVMNTDNQFQNQPQQQNGYPQQGYAQPMNTQYQQPNGPYIYQQPYGIGINNKNKRKQTKQAKQKHELAIIKFIKEKLHKIKEKKENNNQQQVYVQQGYGYPQPNGYVQPQQGYSYPQPNGYIQPQQGYNYPQPNGYVQPQQGYSYQQPNGYVQPQQGYSYQQPNGYVQPQQGYNYQQPNGYVQPQQGYNYQQPNGYMQPQQGYNQYQQNQTQTYYGQNQQNNQNGYNK